MEVCSCRMLFHFESWPGRWLSWLNPFVILRSPQTTTAFLQIAFVYHCTIWALKLLDVFKILYGRRSVEVVRQFWFWIIISLWAGDRPHSTWIWQSEQTQRLRKWGTKCPYKFVKHEHDTGLPDSIDWSSSFHCLSSSIAWFFRSELFSVRTECIASLITIEWWTASKGCCSSYHGWNIWNILCVIYIIYLTAIGF
jgi:hypothetical protein